MQTDLSPEQKRRWEVICGRLAGMAASHGARAVEQNDEVLVLHAPGEGTCIRVWLVGASIAQVDAECLRVSTTWAMTDDEWEDLEQTVASIMDGRAEVTVNYSFNIQHPSGDGTGGGRSESATYRLSGWDAEPRD